MNRLFFTWKDRVGFQVTLCEVPVQQASLQQVSFTVPSVFPCIITIPPSPHTHFTAPCSWSQPISTSSVFKFNVSSSIHDLQGGGGGGVAAADIPFRYLCLWFGPDIELFLTAHACSCWPRNGWRNVRKALRISMTDWTYRRHASARLSVRHTNSEITSDTTVYFYLSYTFRPFAPLTGSIHTET
jgi:hypothetical protein